MIIKRKKAETDLKDIVNVIIIICISIIIMSILVNSLIGSKFKDEIEETNCIASIETHKNFVEALLRTEKKIDENIGLLAYLFDVDKTNVPPIECNTKMIKSKAETKEEAQKELIKLTVKTWNEFGEGEKMFYPDITKDAFCHVRYVVRFNENFQMNNWSNILYYTNIKELFPTSSDNTITIEEYLKRNDDHYFNQVVNIYSSYSNFFAITGFHHDSFKDDYPEYKNWVENCYLGYAHLVTEIPLETQSEGSKSYILALSQTTRMGEIANTEAKDQKIKEHLAVLEANLKEYYETGTLQDYKKQDKYTYYGIVFYEINHISSNGKKIIISAMYVVPYETWMISSMNCEMSVEFEK